jgi:hypothetical protein
LGAATAELRDQMPVTLPLHGIVGIPLPGVDDLGVAGVEKAHPVVREHRSRDLSGDFVLIAVDRGFSTRTTSTRSCRQLSSHRGRDDDHFAIGQHLLFDKDILGRRHRSRGLRRQPGG